MKKVNIGLDLGITSVGWAIADEELNLIERGVRLFGSLDDNGKLANEDRRDKRSMRRQVSRRKNLKKDFIKLLVKSQLAPQEFLDSNGRVKVSLEDFGKKYSINSKDENIIDLRLKATKEKIELQKLIGVLYWYLSNRGFEYEIAGDDELKAAQKLLDKSSSIEKLVVELQKEYFDKNGFFRKNLNRNFSTKQYLKELKLILNNSDFNNDFHESYLKLFQRRRNFEQGPGPQSKEIAQKMANLPMHKGLFKRSRFSLNEDNLVEVAGSVWEKTIGKCSVYRDENRAPKNAFISEVFNLLNDLNNLYVYDATSNGTQKLTKEDKIYIINKSFDTKANLKQTLKFIADKYNCEEEDVLGFRIKTKKNNETEKSLTELSSYHEVKKAFKVSEINFPTLIFTGDFKIFEIIDEIIEPCYKYREIEKRITAFKEIQILKNLDENKLQKLAQISISNATHALSFKALKEYSLLLLDRQDNFSKIWYENRQEQSSKTVSRKYIPLEWIDDLIASPTIKRGIRQAIKVLNAIIKTRDYEVENIVIEMARETNDEQAKRNIKELQATLQTIKDQIRIKIENGTSSSFKPSKNIITKLWLWEQQGGRDPYDGTLLPSCEEIMRNPNLVDIDHIIPYSQSFDDSRSNKVLTKKEHNSAKGNMTANQYIANKFGIQEMGELFEIWKTMFVTNSVVGFRSQKKFMYITDATDYSNPTNSFGFIGRNIVDTRYIAKEVFAKLQEFINNTNVEHPWHSAKVKTINGKMTSFLGKLIEEGGKLIRPEGFENDGRKDEKTGLKNRDWNGHHSEDAFLILHGALKNRKLNKYIEKTLSNPFLSDVEKEEFRKDMESKYAKEDLDFKKKMDVGLIREQLNGSVNEVKFSYMLTTRNNRKFFNETFYKGRYVNGELRKVAKIALKTADVKTLSKIFGNSYKYDIPMKKFDMNTFNELKKKFELNISDEKPFSKHCDDKGRVKLSVGKNNTIRYISAITVIREAKSELEVVKTNNNGNSFFELMEWIELHIYKNENNKNKIIPITAANHKIENGKFTPKKDVINQIFKEKNISSDSKPWIKLKYGSQVMDLDGNIYRVVGQYHSADSIELKRIDGFEKSKRQYFTINSRMLNWSAIEIDEIGQTHKIANF